MSKGAMRRWRGLSEIRWVVFLAVLTVLPLLVVERLVENSANGHAVLFSSWRPQSQRNRFSSPSSSSQPSIWSQDPICTTDLEEQLCIYASTSFNKGNGLVLFTTPDTASSLALMLSSVQLPTPLSPPVFQLSPITGKGFGLIATYPISPSQPVLTSLPVLLFHPSPDLSTQRREHYLSLAISLLSPSTGASFLQQSYPTTGPYSAFPLQSILKHNSFAVHLPSSPSPDKPSQSSLHLAIYPPTSRLNHDCAANTQYYIDPSTLAQHIHAVRPIRPDEELTISYISPLQSTTSRQRMLNEAFSFTCTCSRCSSPSESDVTLSEIIELQDTLSLCISDPNANPCPTVSSVVTSIINRSLELYESQGLQGSLHVPYSHAANAATAILGDLAAAQRYANLTARALSLSKGPESAEVKMWREIASGG